MHEQPRSDFIPTWKVVQTFEEKGVVVGVWKSDHRLPKYRVDVGFALESGKTVRSLSIFARDGEVTTTSPVDVISQLFKKAWDHASELIKEDFKRFSDDRARRGFRGDGRPGERPGLKNLRKQGRRDWEERQRREKD